MRRSAAVVAVVAGLVVCGLLAGCGGGPSDEEKLADDLQTEEYGNMGRERAECVANQIYERFTDEEIDAFEEAEGDRDALPDSLLEKLQLALTPCAGS